MLPTPLITTVVVEALVVLTLGILLVTMRDDPNAPLVVGILLIVLAVFVASFLMFPGALAYLVAKTRICNL